METFYIPIIVAVIGAIATIISASIESRKEKPKTNETDPSPRPRLVFVAYFSAGIAMTGLVVGLVVFWSLNTQKLVAAQVGVINNALPIGSIVAFGGSKESIPDNWILCDGHPLLRKEEPALFAKIKTNWGAGDGGTTFNIPDLRGQFLRGVNGDSKVDPDAAERVAKSGGNAGNSVGSTRRTPCKDITTTPE